MNQTKPYFILLLLFSSIYASAQDTLRINFDPEYHFLTDKNIGFMKLVAMHDNNIIEYERNSYKIKYPKNFHVRDTAVAFNYFTGWEDPAIEDCTVFLFGNYASKSPIVYVDYNHNLDFSDDGQPLKFKSDSTLIVYLKHSKNVEASFPIKFFYPKLSAERKKQAESIFLSMGPQVDDNNLASFDYWLGDLRMNNKLTDTWLNGSAIKIGLYDWDCNGLFNDEDQDRIMIGSYGQDSISHEGAVVYKKNVQIQLGNEIYEVVNIDPAGKFLDITISDRHYVKPLGIGDDIGDLEIETISGEITTLDQLQKENKYTLLDFWGTWCKGCIQSVPELKNLAKDKSNVLQIIGLNYGDDISNITAFMEEKNISWTNGIAKEKIMRLLNIDRFPNYMLISPDNKIIITTRNLEEIEKLL